MQNANIDWREYEKAASGFYPARFDAEAWVKAIKDSGAKYITITSRHHDGFSMWGTKQSDFNIVDATPYGKDVLKMLADECHKQGVMLNFYYSVGSLEKAIHEIKNHDIFQIKHRAKEDNDYDYIPLLPDSEYFIY